MIGARHLAEVDLDVALMRQLGDELLHRFDRHQIVLGAVQDEARGGAGREKREVVDIGRRGHGDEALDLGPPHQQLHRDPGAERKAGDPAGGRIRVIGLQPVERRGGVGQFALAAVEAALAASHSAEVEAQGRKAAAHEALIQGVDDLVVHRAAVLRMRVQHQRHRRRRRALVMVARLDTPLGAVDDHVRHSWSSTTPTRTLGYWRRMVAYRVRNS